MKLTPGKLAGIKDVSNQRGVIAAAAMDQRGSLKKALGSYATDAGLEEFKINVSEVLTKHASAILLDPEWGLPAAKRRAKGSGLLLAYEKTGYDKTLPGRLPDLLDLWSVKRLKEAGADCIKILLYYSTLRRPEDQRSRSTPGPSASATSARPTTSHSFSNSSATKRAWTRRAPSTRS